MELFDTHCHIQSAGLADGERSTREIWAKDAALDPDALVANARANNVTRMICVGCDLADSQLAIDCAASRDGCWASIGIHPHEAAAASADPAILPAFAKLATAAKVVAIGECGLDYFYEHSPREAQLSVLRFQLELAAEHNLPVIFHVREAFDDFWPLFDSFAGRVRGVLHSFTDSRTNLDRAMACGLHIGVNGILTFAKDPLQLEVYKAIPPERLLFETDSPFLTPVPFRGKINEPKQITTVAAAYSELTGMTVEELAQITTQNARALFGV